MPSLPADKLSTRTPITTIPADTRIPLLLTPAAAPAVADRNPTGGAAAVGAWLSPYLSIGFGELAGEPTDSAPLVDFVAGKADLNLLTGKLVATQFPAGQGLRESTGGLFATTAVDYVSETPAFSDPAVALNAELGRAYTTGGNDVILPATSGSGPNGLLIALRNKSTGTPSSVFLADGITLFTTLFPAEYLSVKYEDTGYEVVVRGSVNGLGGGTQAHTESYTATVAEAQPTIYRAGAFFYFDVSCAGTQLVLGTHYTFDGAGNLFILEDAGVDIGELVGFSYFKTLDVAPDRYAVPGTLQTTVVAGTFSTTGSTAGEMTSPATPAGSVRGMRFKKAAALYEFMPNDAGTADVWVRSSIS